VTQSPCLQGSRPGGAGVWRGAWTAVRAPVRRGPGPPGGRRHRAGADATTRR